MQTYDPDKNPTEVRQGNPRRMNFRVLIISMVVLIALFAIIYMVYTGTQPNPN